MTDFIVRRLAQMAAQGTEDVRRAYNDAIKHLTPAQHAELDEILSRAGL